MKKKILIFILVVFLFVLTGCGNTPTVDKSITVDIDKPYIEVVLENSKIENIIGFLSVSEYDVPSDSKLLSGKYFAFYQANSVLPKGEYYPIQAEIEDDTNYSYPEIVLSGLNYAGWFKGDGTRISTVQADDILYVRYISFGEAGLVVLICMLIVFSLLALLALIVSLFKYFNANSEKQKPEQEKVQTTVAPKPQIKLEDITDEDMMAAVLVATIDYHEETQQDVKVVSVREIK